MRGFEHDTVPAKISKVRSSTLGPRLDYEQPHEPAGSAVSNPSMG
jgi:hypothetical protein